MAGMPIRRKRRELRDRQMREQWEKDAASALGLDRPPLDAAADGTPPERETKFAMMSEAMDLALQRALDILRLPLDPGHPDFLKLLQVQRDTISAVASMQVRTDPGALRGRSKDKMAEVWEAIRRREPTRAPAVAAAAPPSEPLSE